MPRNLQDLGVSHWWLVGNKGIYQMGMRFPDSLENPVRFWVPGFKPSETRPETSPTPGECRDHIMLIIGFIM